MKKAKNKDEQKMKQTKNHTGYHIPIFSHSDVDVIIRTDFPMCVMNYESHTSAKKEEYFVMSNVKYRIWFEYYEICKLAHLFNNIQISTAEWTWELKQK